MTTERERGGDPQAGKGVTEKFDTQPANKYKGEVIRLPYVSDKPQSYWGDRDEHGLSGEQTWEFYASYMLGAQTGDALLYAKTHCETLQQYGFGKYSLLTELWAVQSERALCGGNLIAHAEVSKLAFTPGVRICCVVGSLMSSQMAWVLAADYPNAEIVCVKISNDPDLTATEKGPENFREIICRVNEPIPLPSEHFDVVIARRCWVMVAKANRLTMYTDEFYRITKPGGRCEVMGPSKEVFESNGPENEKILEFLDCIDFSNFRSRFYTTARAAGFVDLTTCFLGLMCGIGSDEVSYCSEYIVLFYRAVILYMLKDPELFPGGVGEQTIRALMNTGRRGSDSGHNNNKSCANLPKMTFIAMQKPRR